MEKNKGVPTVHSSAARRIRSLKFSSLIASAIVVCVGGVVIVGWVFSVRLSRIFPGLNMMSPNAALGLLLAGTSQWLLVSGERHRWRRRVAQGCAGAVALMGLLTCGEYFFGWNLNMGQFLFREPLRSAEILVQLRMAPSTAFSLFLIGIALLLLDVETPRGVRPAEQIAIVTIVLSMLAFIGYILDFPIYGVSFYNQMAFYSALALMLLGCGILFARPDRGVMAVVTSDSSGGFLARRFLPASMGVPIVIGWLRLLGERAGFYNVELGRLFIVLATIIAFSAITWWNAKLLNQIDDRRRTAEEALKSHQKELEKVNERLKEMDRVKTEFMNTLNHEIKTPLASIQGGIHLVLDDSSRLQPEQISFLQTAKSNVDRLYRLVDRLLDISTIEAGRPSFRFAPFELSLLIEEGISSYSLKAKEKEIHLSATSMPGVIQVKIDHDRILEVLDNLINNAMKFTAAGGEIRVMARQWDATFVCIEVADNGIGIIPEDQKRLFQRFPRIMHKNEKKPEGTGLGLAICKVIIEAHGGKIWAESEPNKGSRFYFTVPFYQKKPAASG